MPRKIKLSTKILGMLNLKAMFCCAALIFLYSANLLAADFSNNLPTAVLSGLKLGSSYKLKDLINFDLEWSFNGSGTVGFIIYPANWGFELNSGYEFYPDTSTVTITPSSFTITNNGKTITDVMIEIPQNVAYLGKKFELKIVGGVQTGTGGVPGAASKLFLDMSPQFIGYGITGYETLSKIGLIGNKAIVKTKIASVQAPTVTMFYRKKGETDWVTATPLNANPAVNTDGSRDFSFEIPASAITTAGVQYYIKSITGDDYAYAPETTVDENHPMTVFNGTPYEIEVTRITTGQISPASTTLAVLDGNPDDGQVQIKTPLNAVSKSIDVTLEQIDVSSTESPAVPDYCLSDKPAMIFKFGPENTKFNKNVDISLLYIDLNNDGIVDDITDRDGNIAIQASSLRVFFWDGFSWRMVLGKHTLDLTKHIVTVKTDHFSYYALLPVDILSPEDYRPSKKIITPNGDGINDDADFNGLSSEVKIFDITGKKIRTVDAGVGLWNGKDDDGNIAESGVYIYQYKVDGTLVSGAIAVAK